MQAWWDERLTHHWKTTKSIRGHAVLHGHHHLHLVEISCAKVHVLKIVWHVSKTETSARIGLLWILIAALFTLLRLIRASFPSDVPFSLRLDEFRTLPSVGIGFSYLGRLSLLVCQHGSLVICTGKHTSASASPGASLAGLPSSVIPVSKPLTTASAPCAGSADTESGT
jgi:hypothetical protein